MRNLLKGMLLMWLVSGVAAPFQFSFSWAGLKNCDTGYPNWVSNPPFYFKNVPVGTQWIFFKMVDLQAPGYHHGGGWVQYRGRQAIKRDQFHYRSPCPPGGVHTYRWTAWACRSKSLNHPLARAQRSRPYPLKSGFY